jgi:hypothetical protein
MIGNKRGAEAAGITLTGGSVGERSWCREAGAEATVERQEVNMPA